MLSVSELNTKLQKKREAELAKNRKRKAVSKVSRHQFIDVETLILLGQDLDYRRSKSEHYLSMKQIKQSMEYRNQQSALNAWTLNDEKQFKTRLQAHDFNEALSGINVRRAVFLNKIMQGLVKPEQFELVGRLQEWLNKPSGVLVLHGKSESGKTMLAKSLTLQKVFENYQRGRFKHGDYRFFDVGSGELKSAYCKHFLPADVNLANAQKALQAKFIVLDNVDFSNIDVFSFNFFKNALYQCINGRCHLVITTKNNPKKLRELLSDSIFEILLRGMLESVKENFKIDLKNGDYWGY